MTDQPDNSTEIEFELSTDKVVTNDTVKISCVVSVMLSGEVTNSNLKDSVNYILKNFITGDWVFSNPTRQFDTGIEKATYAAHIRIPASENYDLMGRAAKVNSAGIQISNIVPDVSIPEYQIRQARSDLRVELLKQAREEAHKLSDDISHDFKVKKIVFGEENQFSNAKSMRAGSYAATAFSDAGGEAIGNSERISVSATVVLRAQG